MPDFNQYDAEFDALIPTLQNFQMSTEDGEFIQLKPEELAEYAPEGSVVQVHVYEGPKGKGYIAKAKVEIDGESYTKQIDFGPEGRSTEWEQILPLNI